jgi:3-isopropylmalate/(R)-2-methylmalate dehydratase large subunit
MLERYALPGQIVVGTDSHTPHSGALGCLAFGIGTTDIATAWITGDVRVTVPPTTRILLQGRLPEGTTAKDLMLHLLALPEVREGALIGQAIEYQGEALEFLDPDERATLTNMAAEIGGFTGIIAPDGETQRFLTERRGAEIACEDWMRSDPEAQYHQTLRLNCSAIAPMVARPGDPGQGTPLDALEEEVAVHLAYAGSCTGGKRRDLAQVHEVLAWGLAHGLRVHPSVRLFIQFGSEDVRRHAEAAGWIQTFRDSGARLLGPGCGACINAGPGVSTLREEVTVSAVNRNFPGRSGPGQVWLASPATVAASALAGRLRSFPALRRTR